MTTERPRNATGKVMEDALGPASLPRSVASVTKDTERTTE